MNPFFNPVILTRVCFSYLRDINRIYSFGPEKLKRFRENAFQQVLKQAAQTPMYREKYRGIDISTVTLETIHELPVLTKTDIRKHFPVGVVPDGYDRNRALTVSTSGSTGQPTSLYTDFYTVTKALMGFIREIREYGISWRKDRMTIIADLTAGSAEEAYLNQTVVPNLKPFFSLDNMQLLHVGLDIKEMLSQIEAHQPRFIGGYPGALRDLAVLKRKGYGKTIRPDYIASSGAVLDEYTKRYIEETFGAYVFDVYGSTEAGPVAFECREGRYHIHHDMVHLEFLDDRGRPVPCGTPGHIIVTKLYGTATPIIRYDGLNDFVIPLAGTCRCGLHTPLIGKIGGRRADSIVLPDGTMIPPSAITGIPGKVMEALDTKKILQFQILQKTSERVEVRVVIDPDLRSVGPSVETLFADLKHKFEQRFKNEVNVDIIEVKAIEKPADLDTPAPVVTSLVQPP
jgi:phenylacetate-CoA ligase